MSKIGLRFITGLALTVSGADLTAQVLSQQSPPAQTGAPATTQPAPSDRGQDWWALESMDNQFSYSMGVDLGNRYGRGTNAIKLNPQMVANGVADAINKKVVITASQLIDAAETGGQKLVEAWKQKQAEDARLNRDFLKENHAKEGVQETASGLQYIVLREGEGRQPKPTDIVRVHYAGKLVNGTEFDSSYARGEPSIFSVQAVIDGWKEALPMMREGAKWRLFVPPALGYAGSGDGDKIPPDAVLIFELELISVQ